MNRILVFAVAAVILTAGAIGGYFYYSGLNVASPSPTPSPTVTPTPSITPSLSPSFSPSPSPSYAPTPSPTPSPTPKPSDKPTPFPTPSPTPSPSPTPTPNPSPTPTPYYTIHVVNSSLYLDSDGYAHVFGEVENNGTDPLELVRVSTKLYNASDVVVAASFVYIDLEIILPGERSPFEILILDPKDAVYHDVKISSYYVTFNYPYRDFEILSEDSSVDDDGYLHVTGEVRNNGAKTVKSVRVSAIFYDSNNTVIAATSAYTQEELVEEGQTGTFEILLTYDDLVPIVDNYSLVVQGNP